MKPLGRCCLISSGRSPHLSPYWSSPGLGSTRSNLFVLFSDVVRSVRLLPLFLSLSLFLPSIGSSQAQGMPGTSPTAASTGALNPPEERAGPPPAPFAGTWKLLDSEQKRQFIAGYLFGWRDSLKVSEVVLQFIRDNPTEAAGGMERILALYSVSQLQPEQVVQEMDRFFGDPAHSSGTLNEAMSVARGRLRRE